MSVPLKDMKITIKEQYKQKIEQLKSTILNSITSFEKDSGCKVTGITYDYGWNVLSLKIKTDIHK